MAFLGSYSVCLPAKGQAGESETEMLQVANFSIDFLSLFFQSGQGQD